MLYSRTGKSTSSQRIVFKREQNLVQWKARNESGSAGQPDLLLVDGLAKLAPGLKTARQTGPGETAVAHLTLCTTRTLPTPEFGQP